MSYSLNTFNQTFSQHLVQLAPNQILDVGAGQGKYGRLVTEQLPQSTVHAIEPTAGYIEQFGLKQIYHTVYQKTLQEFANENFRNRYNLVIFGDVLEHLYRSQVIDYLDFFLYRTDWALVLWPTNMAQDDYGGNHWEIHRSNFALRDLADRFDVHYYEKRFAWFQGMGQQDPEFTHSDYHYVLIKGHVTRRSTGL